ncbi:MAG: T9SS type A sorting domain-containing protein [Bacteroidia bacterium]
MKKTLLTTAAFALLSAGVMAQGSLNLSNQVKKNKISTNAQAAVSSTTGGTKYNRCGTVAPSAQWDAEFNKQVEDYKAKLESDMLNGRTTSTTYTLPIIFHIIHDGSPVGTFPNLAAAQVNSQITVLNQDYSGNGYKANTYPAGAFSGYAAAATNSVSAASKDGTGRVAIANTGISFCAATKDPNGVTLAEPGIERISYVTKGWTNPATLTSSNFQSYIDGTIKPATIWDVTKYFNVWLTDEDMTSANSPGLLGYSTFPASSTLTGLSAPYGSATTDGCWFYSKVCGSATIYPTGTYDPTYKYGRTICHECGHYLGLRHPWGDNGQCNGTDYCNDTPPEQGTAGPPAGCYYGTPTYPSQAASCTYGGQTNTNGDMFMNIMDYTDDIAMYMFTNDQAIRMQTAMANSPNRKLLTASSANLCAGTTVTAPVAGFTYPSTTLCSGSAIPFTDASTGPAATYTWSSSPSTGVTINTVNSSNPTITFPAAGTYTITQAVTNTVGTNSVSHAVTVSSCTVSGCDTLGNIVSADTLTIYNVTHGYLAGNGSVTSGTVTLTSKTIAETYAQTTFPSNTTMVKGAMILFYDKVAGSVGTKGTSTLTLKMTGTTTNSSGIIPNATAVATQTLSLSSVVASPNTAGPDYAGNQLYNFTGFMKAYPVTFTNQVPMTSTFALTLSLPTVAGDTAVVFSNTGHVTTAATGCVQYGTTWYNASAFSLNLGFGIIPIVCPPSGIEQNHLGSNINLFPNPNSGQFNFAITLPEAANLNFTVVNMLGQVVYTKSENGVTNAVLSCDLSHLAKGVYYANITDDKNNRTIKKIIIE